VARFFFFFSVVLVSCFQIFLQQGLTPNVAQAGLKRTILLPLLPECWDYRCALPRPASVSVLIHHPSPKPWSRVCGRTRRGEEIAVLS
jgi:hypothetical protein